MRTALCGQLGIEFPIFACTHCRDVVAAVSNAGVLGALGYTPDPLGMPLQSMVTMDAIVRTQRYAGSEQAQAVSFNPVGQVVGMMSEIRSTREVIFDLVQEYADAVDKLNALNID